MRLFMDVHHTLPEGATAKDVADAHPAALCVQEKYNVSYLSSWVAEAQGKVFCLVEAPDPEAAIACHREAYGLTADEIHEVVQG